MYYVNNIINTIVGFIFLAIICLVIFGLPAAMHHARHTLPDRLDALPAVRAVHRALPGRRHCAVACIT